MEAGTLLLPKKVILWGYYKTKKWNPLPTKVGSFQKTKEKMVKTKDNKESPNQKIGDFVQSKLSGWSQWNM